MLRRLVPPPLLLLALALPAAALAQDQPLPPVPPNFSALLGEVSDSIRGGPLVGAHVSIVGTTREGVTDLNGVFRIDSIPPGEHQLLVTHPLLDTLGLTILSQPFEFAAGQRRELGAHTPTFVEVHDKLCPHGGPSLGSAMLVGRVKHADTDQPAAGAAVSLVFKEVGAAGGAAGAAASALAPTAASGVERVRNGRVGPDGIFAICGLPPSILGSVQASLDGVNTADFPIRIGDGSVATAVLSIGGSGTGTAVLHGKVLTMTGAPVANAQVALIGTSQITTTADDGSFTLTGLPSGTQQAVVRRIGYSMTSQTVQLAAKEPAQVSIMLHDAQVLTTVHVVGKLDIGLDRIGFTDRKKLGNGWFMTPDQIEAKAPEITTDVLRSTAGLRVVTEGTGRYLATQRQGGCVNMFIDHGRFDQVQPGDLDDAVPVGDLGAIEFYSSGATTPAEFSVPTGGDCATLVIWTKTLLSGQKR